MEVFQTEPFFKFFISVADPWHFGTDPVDLYLWLADPLDRTIFISYLQDGNKNYFFQKFFSLLPVLF